MRLADTKRTKVFWPMDSALGAPTQVTGVWMKPPEAQFVAIWAIGAGAGGGGGRSVASGTAKGGGGGGGGGGLGFLILPAFLVPDVLYVLVGQGGLGGGPGTNGSDGGQTIVGIHTAPDSLIRFLDPAGSNAVGGAGTTTTTGGAGGAGATLPGGDHGLDPLGMLATAAGNAGAAGGSSGANGTSVNPGTGLPVQGGAGGAGAGTGTTGFDGGDQNAVANSPFVESSGPTTDSEGGTPGFIYADFPWVYGATGGASDGDAPGGNGGSNGCNAPGAGGGGGGAGTTAGTGGQGGPGVVVISWW